VEREAAERVQSDGPVPAEQNGVRIRQPDRQQVRRKPAVGGGDGGGAARGGGGVGEGERVLRARQQHVRGEARVRGLHAGGVEEFDGGGVR